MCVRVCVRERERERGGGGGEKNIDNSMLAINLGKIRTRPTKVRPLCVKMFSNLSPAKIMPNLTGHLEARQISTLSW
jgi:hypothetical protein